MNHDSFPYPRVRQHVGHLVLPNPDPTAHLRHREQEKQDRAEGEAIREMVTPEQGAAMADLAGKCLQAGELQRGIQAIALAVAVEPGNPVWRKLLESYLERVEGGESALVPERAFPWFLFNPVGAYLAYRRGCLAKEMPFITGVVQSYPERGYLEHWVLPWLDLQTIKSVEFGDLLHFFAVLVKRYPEHGELSANQEEHLTLALDRMRLAETAHGFDSKLLVLKLMAMRKLGRFGEAVEEGKAAHAANPSWHSAIAIANTLKRAGDVGGAIAYFREAAQLDAGDVSALLEVGDMDIAKEDWAEALEAYEQALAREPKHPWAAPSAAFCRYQLRGDRSELGRLRRMARAGRDRCGVQGFLAGVTGETPPGVRQQRAQQLLLLLKESGK